jgi:hypothetical protein
MLSEVGFKDSKWNELVRTGDFSDEADEISSPC